MEKSGYFDIYWKLFSLKWDITKIVNLLIVLSPVKDRRQEGNFSSEFILTNKEDDLDICNYIITELREFQKERWVLPALYPTLEAVRF